MDVKAFKTYPGDEHNPDQAPHKHIVSVTKDSTGFYVAHNKQFGIIVQGESIEKVSDLVTEAIEILWEKFPETHDKIYPRHISAKEAAKYKTPHKQAIAISVR